MRPPSFHVFLSFMSYNIVITKGGNHMSKYDKIGLSFAGGGLKSFSHVAVVKDLEINGVDISAVSGTSMGSVLASLYACGIRGQALEVKMLELEKEFQERKIMLKPTLKILPFVKDRSDGLIEQSSFRIFIEEIFEKLGITKLSEVPFPLCVVATELNTGEIILFANDRKYFQAVGNDCRFYDDDIDIATAIAASCAFPLVFQSVEIDGMRLVDGGVRLNSPGDVFNKEVIKKVISMTTMNTDTDEVDHSMLNVAFQCVLIMMNQLEKTSLISSDIHLNFPLDFKLIFEVGRGHEVIEKAHNHLKDHPIDYSVLEKKKTLFNLWGHLD